MSGVVVDVLDPVMCRVSSDAAIFKKIKAHLSYKEVFYKKQQFGTIKKPHNKSMMDPKGNLPVGMLPSVREWAGQHKVRLEVRGEDNLLLVEGVGRPFLPGVEFRPDQKRLIATALARQRGILVSPTGTGKTVLMMGVLSAFKTIKAMVVVPSKDLLTQTHSEFRKHGFGKVGMVGAGRKKLSGYNIVVATRQTAVRLLEDPWFDDLEAILVDEAHLFGDREGELATILKSSAAGMRLGFTATPPKKGSIAKAAEAYLGPVIDEVTWKEAQDGDMMAVPRVRLLPVRENSTISDSRTYKAMEEAGIVSNRHRNRLIVETAKDLVDTGKRVLIFINKLAHGDNLVDMAATVGLQVQYVEGATDAKLRDSIKEAVISNKVKCVITSKVWREGVNIPALDAVILAGGGRTELGTLQSIGRVLRKTDDKDTGLIIDLLDPYRYLAEHSIQRVSIYAREGWL